MKRKHYTPFCLFLCLLLCAPLQSLATHIVGGYVHYDCVRIVGNYTVIKVHLEVIREATQGGSSFDDPLEMGAYHEINGEWQYTGGIRMQLDSVVLLSTTEPEYQYRPHSHWRMEKAYYSKEEYGILNNQGDFMIAHQRCCRLENPFTNTSGLGSLGMAYHVFITEEGLQQCNSSTKLNLDEERYFFLDSLSIKDFNANNPDQDSTYIQFTAPVIAGGLVGTTGLPGDPGACDGVTPFDDLCPPPFDEMSFDPGYSATQPFGVNTNFVVNAQTGIISGIPTEEGLFQIALKIDEYRNGIFMGYAIAEYIIEVVPKIDVAIVNIHPFWDANRDGIRDTSESEFDIALGVLETPNGFQKISNTLHRLYARSIGEYTFFTRSKPQWRINSPTDSLKFEVDQLLKTYEVDLPIVPIHDDLIYESFVKLGLPLCNRTNTLSVEITNLSTQTLTDLTARITIDSLTSFVPAVNTQSIFKVFASISPGRKKSVNLQIKMPDETFIGERLNFSVVIEGGNADTTYQDTIKIDAVVLCSFDPNDKLAYPDRETGHILPDEELNYVIRFQNTGNFSAKDVILIDTLDNNLDASSIHFFGSSHYYRFKQTGNIIQFQFLNIYLPDSTSNPEKSQGYVSFRIRPKPSLSDLTDIHNRAAIYFDQNPPIITNTVTRTLAIPEEEQFYFDVYPNPYHNQIFVDRNGYLFSNLQIEIYDLLGRKLGVQSLPDERNTVPLQQLGQGVYVYRIIGVNGEELQAGKIVKQ
ncbi:MAG: T9SS type A sorting domain-containing protein [Bacteroidota bacterium]